MFCSNCGTKLPDTAMFCPKCGTPVQQEDAPEPGQKPESGKRGQGAIQASSGGAKQSAAVAQSPASPAIAPSQTQRAQAPMPPVPAGASASVDSQVPYVKLRQVTDVLVHEHIFEYSWEELSFISGMIAQAANDELGMEIAQHFNLVKPDGSFPCMPGDPRTGKGMVEAKEFNCICYEYSRDKEQDAYQVQSMVGKCFARIIGFRSDVRSDGTGRAGITFACALTRQFEHAGDAELKKASIGPCMLPFNTEETVAGGWELSFVRRFLNNEFLQGIEFELGSLIVPVQKRTNNAGAAWIGGMAAQEMVTETSDRLWLPSAIEEVGLGGLSSLPWYNHDSTQEQGDEAAKYRGTSPLVLEGQQYQAYKDEGTTYPYPGAVGCMTRSVWAESPLAENPGHGLTPASEPAFIVSDAEKVMCGSVSRSAKDPFNCLPCFCL